MQLVYRKKAKLKTIKLLFLRSTAKLNTSYTHVSYGFNFWFASKIETMHLLGSMKNAARLYESMKEIRDQKGQTHDLIED